MEALTRKVVAWLAGSASVCLIGAAVYSHPPSFLAARACTGADDCKVCKNCRYCGHCAKQGGTCGVKRAATQKAKKEDGR
jgi:hypothetical protein